HGKASSDVSAASIQDIATAADSQRAIGGTIGLMSMAAPYGGGRVLSLFRTKIHTLTVQYRDADGGLHGAIFTMPVGTSEVIKKELLAQRSEEHTSELQSRGHLVCRLLLEKKKTTHKSSTKTDIQCTQ